jgi:hypothetical protein
MEDGDLRLPRTAATFGLRRQLAAAGGGHGWPGCGRPGPTVAGRDRLGSWPGPDVVRVNRTGENQSGNCGNSFGPVPVRSVPNRSKFKN